MTSSADDMLVLTSAIDNGSNEEPSSILKRFDVNGNISHRSPKGRGHHDRPIT